MASEIVLTDLTVDRIYALAIGFLPKANYDLVEAAKMAAAEWSRLGEEMEGGIRVAPNAVLGFGLPKKDGVGGNHWVLKID